MYSIFQIQKNMRVEKNMKIRKNNYNNIYFVNGLHESMFPSNAIIQSVELTEKELKRIIEVNKDQIRSYIGHIDICNEYGVCYNRNTCFVEVNDILLLISKKYPRKGTSCDINDNTFHLFTISDSELTGEELEQIKINLGLIKNKSIMKFDSKFYPLVKNGEKTTTWRYGHFKNKEGNILHSGHMIARFHDEECEDIPILVKPFKVKPLKYLTDDEAIEDGFNCKEELQKELKGYYPFINDETFLICYKIQKQEV